MSDKAVPESLDSTPWGRDDLSLAEEGLEGEIREIVRQRLGREVRSLEPVAQGLGRRRFFRVRLRHGDPSTLVARVEAAEDGSGRPLGSPPEPPLEPLRTFLAERGVPVPLRFGGDPAAGIDLLEDVGERSLQREVCQAGVGARRALYEEACDLVVRIQRAGEHRALLPAFTRKLDRTLIAYKADRFAEWSLRTALGRAPSAGEREAVHEAFEVVADEVESAPKRLAHRDFQSSNLFVRSRRRAGRRLVMIDFQGAFMAPPEYDLVCLLRDSYVELAPEEVEHQLQRIRLRLPDRPTTDDFQRRFHLLTLSRKGKDHSLFLSAAMVRDDGR